MASVEIAFGDACDHVVTDDARGHPIIGQERHLDSLAP
jgi:hypothetical protein